MYKEKPAEGRVGLEGDMGSDVIDLTAHTSPGDKDTKRSRDGVEEALTDGWREDSREAVSGWRLWTMKEVPA